MDAVLAVNNFGDTRSGGLAGPMGLFVILLLVIGTVLLIRNMNARLRRLPDSFDDRPDARRDPSGAADEPAADAGPATTGTTPAGPAGAPGGTDAEVAARPPAEPPPGGPDRG